MTMTTQQAARRLKVSTTTVRNLGNKGKIERIEVGKGKKKRRFAYKAKSVSALAKEINAEPRRRKGPSGILTKLENRLDIIERKLDKILKLWS